MKEERITDPVTGGQKGKKLPQQSALDPVALEKLAEIGGFGMDKYERYNFMKGYSWSLSYDALMRHLQAFWRGEDYDDESSLLHLGHAMWHCHALISFYERSLGTDDRPPRQGDGDGESKSPQTGQDSQATGSNQTETDRTSVRGGTVRSTFDRVFEYKY